MIPLVRLAILLGAFVLTGATCPSGGVDVVVGEGEGEGEPAEGEGEPAEGEGEPAEGEGEPAEGEGEGEPAEGEGEGEPSTGIGTFADPIVVDSFPFHDERDTTAAPGPGFDLYSCSSANEGGDAFVYRVVTSERGVLSVHVEDDASAGVDIDVHLLSSASADACVARANTDLSTVVDAGSHLVVADTYGGGGDPQAGPFAIDFTFSPLEGGNCATQSSSLRMFWPSCPAGLAGCDDSGADTVLTLPVLGNLVKEAHLVTEEDGFGNSWPTSFTDGINEHWALSQAATGYLMTRDQPWAPAGEGGSEFGQGATSVPLPVLDEAWYINMYWRDRPARGTRMILKNPANGRAVVASAGWETGPGSNSWVGGATEEVLDWLQRGSGPIELGFAVDQTLPFGPIDCP